MLRRLPKMATLAALALTLGCGGNHGGASPSPTAFLGPLRHQQVGEVNFAYYRFGSGRPLVLVQAFGVTMSNWTLPLLKQLSSRYDVTIFDNRGMGLSTDASPDPLTYNGMADSTVGLIQALGLHKPDVLGWSMGAETCFTIATRNPASIGRIISVGGDVGSPNTLPPTDAFLAVAFDPNATPQEACSVLFPPGHQSAIDSYLAGWAAMPADPPTPSGVQSQIGAYAAFSADSTVWDAVPHITNPVLLITGAEDEGCPPENSERLVKRFPNAHLLELANAGHAVLFQESDACLSAIHIFLAN